MNENASTYEPPATYEELDRRAFEAFHDGRLPEAESLCLQAIEAARAGDDAELIDRAKCNWASVVMANGRWREPLAELRRISMATASLEIGFLATYNIARAYELGKETKKGFFYARIARDRAEALGDPMKRYAARHQIANFQTADSLFEEATETYRTALELLPASQRDDQLEAAINVAYCELMQGEVRKALGGLYRALRRSRREGSIRLEALAHQDLALALLEAKRPDLATRHASRALDQARDRGEADVEKNSLFLLAESLEQRGFHEDASTLRRELQDRFYPEQPQLPELLSRVNVRQIVNLRA